MEEVETKIKDAARYLLAVNQNVLFRQVPSARTDHEGSNLVVQPVGFSFGTLIAYGFIDRVAQVYMAIDQVLPTRSVRILEIGHKDLCAGVQGINDHLP